MRNRNAREQGRNAAQGLRPSALLGVLLALALLLARSGAPPARAQSTEHDWRAGDPPAAEVTLYHLDGTRVTTTTPATRCEVLEIRVAAQSNIWDSDLCVASGHAHSEGIDA